VMATSRKRVARTSGAGTGRMAAGAGALLLALAAACSSGRDPSPAPPGPAPSSGSPSGAPAAPAGPARSVLTGEPGAAGKVLAVKIDNVGAARPQTGLNGAAIVYAIEVEGGLSRLMAVFDTNHLPATVGPVRSARETDLQLLAAYDRPALAFSGAQSHLLPVLRADKDLVAVTDTGAFFRSSAKPEPHNEYLHTRGVADRAGAAKDIGLRFAAKTPSGGAAGERVSVSMPSARFTFTWTGKAYRVAMDGSATAWTADNVIVQHVTVQESHFHSRTGFVPFSRTVGSGTAQILRDGRSYTVRWNRPAPSAGTAYTLNGTTLPLRPGRTWIVLAPG
jgi:hypothetical protein